MVYLCCRIHPLIRDSASARKVPFHVGWWRDMTLSACKKWRARIAMVISIAVVAIVLFVDVVLLKRDGTDSGRAYMNLPSITGNHGHYWIHEHEVPQEDENTVTPWLPVVWMSIVLARMICDPLCTLVNRAWARNWVACLQGSWSWSHLQLTGQTQIATTILAVTEASTRSNKITNMASPTQCFYF